MKFQIISLLSNYSFWLKLLYYSCRVVKCIFIYFIISKLKPFFPGPHTSVLWDHVVPGISDKACASTPDMVSLAINLILFYFNSNVFIQLETVPWSLFLSVRKNQLGLSLPSSVCHDARLETWNWLWWECLQHRTGQEAYKSELSFLCPWPVVKHLSAPYYLHVYLYYLLLVDITWQLDRQLKQGAFMNAFRFCHTYIFSCLQNCCDNMKAPEF